MRTQPASGPAAARAAASGVNGTKGSSAASAITATAMPWHSAHSGIGGAGGWIARRNSAVALIGRTLSVLRYHWLASILIAAGVALRVLAQMAYHPAIIFIDTLKYLYNAWPGSDPVAYHVPLRLILLVRDLRTVEGVQHVLCIAIAVNIYVVMLRRCLPRSLI